MSTELAPEGTIWEGHPHWATMYSPALWIVIAVLTMGIGLLVLVPLALMKAQRTTYKVTTERVIVQEGLLGRKEDDLELLRVKDIRAEEKPMERALKVGTVTLTSTDASHADLRLAGVPDARGLKEHIRAATSAVKRSHGVGYREAV